MVWLCVDPPEVISEMPNEKENKLQVTCHLNTIETIGVMVWDVALVVVCCIFAFMTRKLPENYNETRFITFCSFCTLVVFVTFSPIYFTSREPYYQASYYSAGLIINATVTLTCLFAVKIYALYFVNEEEMNIFTQTRLRANTMTASTRKIQPANTRSSTAQNEVHLNPNYVTETSTEGGDCETDRNEPRENRYRSSSGNSNKSSCKSSSSGGVIDRLRGHNKVDPDDHDDINQITQSNSIAEPDQVVTVSSKLKIRMPGQETKVVFNPDVVELDTHM